MASSSDLLFVVLLVFFICWTRLGLCEDGATDFDRPYPDYHEEKPSTRIPRFKTHGGFIAVKPGETINLKCEVDQLGDLTLMWRKGSNILSMNHIRLTKDNKIKLNTTDFSLEINDASVSDEGLYTCTISASVPLVQSYIIKLLLPSGHHRHHHHHHKTMESIAWELGDDIKMQCLIGDPATVSWTHEDELLSSSHHHLQIISDAKGNRGLLVKSLQSKYFGSYKCLVDRERQQDLEAEFEINAVPKIEVVKERINVDEGITLDIICRFSGYPVPKIRWLHESRPIMSRDRITIGTTEKQSKLTIRQMQQGDFGNYTCVAENKVGSGNQTVELTVETDQLGIAGIVNFRNDPYGEFADHYELNFEVESFKPIIEYRLLIKERQGGSSMTNDENWKEVIIPANASTSSLYSQVYDITGLRPNAVYDIYMQARNYYGWNNRSGIFTFYTKREGTPVSPKNETMEKTMATTNAPFVSEEYSSYMTTNAPAELDSGGSAGFRPAPAKAMVIVVLTVLLAYFT